MPSVSFLGQRKLNAMRYVVLTGEIGCHGYVVRSREM